MTAAGYVDRYHRRLGLLQDPGWRAALTIFTGALLKERNEVWTHIDLEGQVIHIDDMLEDCGALSGGEQRMIRLAVSLFTTERPVDLWSTLAGLVVPNGRLAVDAIQNFLVPDVGEMPRETVARILECFQNVPPRPPRHDTGTEPEGS